MESDFWHERWEKDEIGFHQHDYNPHMREFVDRLGVPTGAQLLVPLCGKSLDMLWLANRGYRVTGVEISELAIKGFFAENGLAHDVRNRAGLVVYQGKNVEVICADFFSLSKTDLPRVDAVYDRASLIALPPDMRQAYAGHLTSLIGTGVRSLLVTLDYPQEEMRGPPFSVTRFEVEQLFGLHYSIEQLRSEDCLADEPRFRKKGLTRLAEHVFVLQKNT